MRLLENYMAFVICTMATITLAVRDDNNYEQFYNDMLELHNKARKAHNANKLVWNYSAKTNTMNHLKLIIDGKIKPTYNHGFYYTYILKDPEQVTAKMIFDFWYQEEKKYNYTQGPNNTETEHFTQIVWKNTKSVGFAFTYENGTNYFAAMYVPRGNVANMYDKNVEIPKSEAS